MISVLWLFYLLLISVLLAFFTYAIFFRKGRLHDSTPAQDKVKYLKKLKRCWQTNKTLALFRSMYTVILSLHREHMHRPTIGAANFSDLTSHAYFQKFEKHLINVLHILPICSTRWKLMAVDSGLRVWQKNVENKPSWMPRTIYACFGIIPASQKEVINILKQPDLMMEWDPAVKNISKVTMATDNDVISVSFNCTSLIARVVHQIRESFGGEINAVYSRHWEVDPSSNSDAWFLSYFVEQVIPAEGTLWSCFLVSSIDNGEDEQLESLVTLVAAPVSPWFASIPTLTASRVAGLQDFFTHYKPDASPNKTCGSQASGTSTSLSSTSDDLSKDLVPRLIAKPSGSQEDEKPSRKNTKGASLSVLDDSQVPGVVSRVDNLLQKLNEVYEGTEGTDGWITVGNVKGVDIMKRPPRAGERPWDCLKGTSVICAPIHYILAYVESLDYRGEWDDMFVKGETVEQYDPITKVARTQFKPVWPASGRDFSNFVVLRELAEGVFCQAYEAVEHENCPEVKDLVRAEVIIGGFVVKELSSDPPSCLVTYITRVDLKGKLPVRLVNKVTSSQPEAVAILRDKLEALYQADVASNSGEMSEIQKLGVDLWTELMKAKEARLPRAGEAAEREEKESVLEWSLVEKHLEDDVSSSDMDSRREPSNFTDSGEMFPATDENMQLPFLDRHNIDFKTLGSQAAANLLGEVLLASKVEISMSEELSELGSSEQEWSYQSIEKDVVILRKISPGEKIHSFLGKGMIKVKPPAVWQAIRNHTTRHMYDKMLKKTRLVRQIDEQTKIIYLHHETTQCFVKQSRDFVMLTSERVEPERYVLAGLSVDIPELPPTKDITRGKIFSSGWIIEPVLQNGQLYSMVSYLSQIDFGGALPIRLINLIARRQPLCIAYLRTYLEKLENNQSP